MDTEHQTGQGVAAEPGSPHPSAAVYRDRYVAALLAGSLPEAASAIDDALAARLPGPVLLLDVVAAAQRTVGERWAAGEISVAQEHWATEVSADAVARLRQALPPARELGLDAVIATPEGERHALPTRLVAALLAWRGWHVDLLGSDLPPGELAAYVDARRPHLVGLSVTLRENLPAAAAAARAVQALPDAPPLLVGGAAFGEPPALPAGFPPVAVAADGPQGVQLAEQLAGGGARPDLAGYLAIVGGRILALRRQRGWSQAELGQAADLTRSYLSAVEQGRQNITLEAALKLATALRVRVGELLDDAT